MKTPLTNLWVTRCSPPLLKHLPWLRPGSLVPSLVLACLKSTETSPIFHEFLKVITNGSENAFACPLHTLKSNMWQNIVKDFIFLSLPVNTDIILCNLVCNEIIQVFILCQNQHFLIKESEENLSIIYTAITFSNFTSDFHRIDIPSKSAHKTDVFLGT